MLKKLLGADSNKAKSTQKQKPANTRQAEDQILLPAEVDILLAKKRQNDLSSQIQRITRDHPELTVQLIQAWLKQDS